MAASKTIDVNAYIERKGLTPLAYFVLVLAFLMMMADGYDFGTLTTAANAILKEWKISRTELGAVFSITFIGLLVGSLIYGWIADRFGRRATIIFGVFNFGIPILLTIWATNITELTILRFIGGVGMGGIVPIAYTLVSEYAPRRSRSTVTVITNSGYNLAAAAGGLIASYTIPAYGWQSVYVIGAIFSAIMAAVMILWMPDSILFLIQKRPNSPQLRRLAERLMREPVPADTQLIAIDPQDETKKIKEAGGFEGFVRLFNGSSRAWATTLLWLLFISDSLGFFFLASWLPVVMKDAGVDPSNRGRSCRLPA